jgi:hypothetical protein
VIPTGQRRVRPAGECCGTATWEIVAVQITSERVLLLGTVDGDEERAGIGNWLEEMARAHMAEPDGLMRLAWAIDRRA